MLLRQALLGGEGARFELGCDQARGVVPIAGVARIKAGLGHQAIERVVGEVIAGAVLVEQGFEAPRVLPNSIANLGLN